MSPLHGIKKDSNNTVRKVDKHYKITLRLKEFLRQNNSETYDKIKSDTGIKIIIVKELYTSFGASQTNNRYRLIRGDC